MSWKHNNTVVVPRHRLAVSGGFCLVTLVLHCRKNRPNLIQDRRFFADIRRESGAVRDGGHIWKNGNDQSGLLYAYTSANKKPMP
jgi:hypothetical protein